MTRPRNSNSDMDNLNKDSRAAAVPVGYVDEDGGEVVALQGDADAPYVIAHGRASSDGSTGLVAEPNGAAQRLALSPLGHAWSDLYVDGAPVSALNPLPTAGAAAGTTDTNIIQVAGTPVVVTTPGVLLVDVNNFPAGGATDITAIAGTPVVVTTPGVLSVDVLNFPAGGATDITAIDGAALAAHTAGELPVQVMNTVAENLTQIGGVALATHTAGVLPVEFATGTWTKSLGSLGVNGDILVVAGAGRIQRITISIFSGSGWLYICDKVALPPTFATLDFPPIPFLTATLASPSYIDITFEDVGGLKYAAGIVIGVSTTGPSPYTAPGANVATGVVTVYYA